MSKKQTEAVSGEVIIPGEESTALVPADNSKRLGAIAKAIRKEVSRTIDGAFATGHLLVEARSLITSDTLFGKWVKEQDLGISQPTANRLRWAAENEEQVREAIAHSSVNGRDIGVVTAVAELNRGEDDRIPRERVKAVQDLMADTEEVTAPVVAQFTALVPLLVEGMPQFANEELAEIAAGIQSIVEAYKPVAKAR